MRVRLRAPGGQHTAELADDATVGDLKSVVFEKTGVAPEAQELKAGFPLKTIEGEDGLSLASCGVTNGESITVAEVATAAPAAAPGPAAVAAMHEPMDEDEALARAIAASLEDTHGDGVGLSPSEAVETNAVRVVIDADNSCLFNAVGYVMRKSLKEAPQLRKVIADVVFGDEFTYNEGFLGKPNAEYCAWILGPNHWGGAVELSILCKHFETEIAAYDIQTKRCDLYGQDQGYPERVMLLYDGLHYDAMALAKPGAARGDDATIVRSTGPEAAEADAKARAVVEQAHAARQFTDTANFALRCLVCQLGLKGEKEAVEHAKTTGHQNFGEY